MNGLKKIQNDFPKARLVEETENGALIQCDKYSYIAIPPKQVPNYETFKNTDMYKFRAFMYYLGTVRCKLNKTVKDGSFCEDLNRETTGKTYYVPFTFQPNIPEQTVPQKNDCCPLKAGVSSRYRCRYE